MRTTPTERQQEVYDFIRETIRDRGFSPTFREIAERLGSVSLNAAAGHVSALERKGWIERTGHFSRSITLLGESDVRVLPDPPDSVDRLTARQLCVYNFIRQSIRDRGQPPTYHEIGQRFGFRSAQGAQCHMEALERHGLIRRENRRARSISLVGRDEPQEISSS